MGHRVDRLFSCRPFGSRSGRWAADKGAAHRFHSACDGEPEVARAYRLVDESDRACMPEAHTLFTALEGTSRGMSALTRAWREGIWPWPASVDLAVDDLLDLVRLHL